MVNQLLRAFAADIEELVTEAAKAAYAIHREPLHMMQSRASEAHHPSNKLAKSLAPPKQINIEHEKWNNLCDEFGDNDY